MIRLEKLFIRASDTFKNRCKILTDGWRNVHLGNNTLVKLNCLKLHNIPGRICFFTFAKKLSEKLKSRDICVQFLNQKPCFPHLYGSLIHELELGEIIFASKGLKNSYVYRIRTWCWEVVKIRIRKAFDIGLI